MAKTITFFNAKGGVGKTLVAVNLAISLAKTKRVCLVDLDLQVVGDMARMLGLKPQKAIVNCFQALKNKGAGVEKEEFLTPVSNNLDFLPAVLEPKFTPFFEAAYLKDILDFLDKRYEYVIIDCGQSFNDALLNALTQANLILLVVTPDILCVQQTKRVLDILQTLLFPLKMIKIVLNRAESISSISWQEIVVALSCDIIVRIPSEGKIVMQAVNLGVPVITNAPRSRITFNIGKLTDEIINNKELFMEHLDILSRPAEINLEKTGEFWEKTGLTTELAGVKAVEAAKHEDEEIFELRQSIHAQLIEELNIKKVNLGTALEVVAELKERAEHIVINLLAEKGKFITSLEARKKIISEIINEALGLGPLEELLHDESVSDIMVNNKDQIYVERRGKIEFTDKRFLSNDQIKTIIERILVPIGRRIDESAPMVDARLSDGSRVNAIIPPLSLTGPCLTIRKFRKESFSAEELVRLGALNSGMAQFLNACVLSRKNIIISGGTGSGKTTILNVLSSFIPGNERIITIEDAAELKLEQEHWVRLESKPPNIEGKGAISIRELFRNTLRMRPDRIVIGECRGIETLDMLQAMNTGHDGSMTTIHANSTLDVLARIDSMILMSGVELPVRAIREMVASAADIIVHTARLFDGKRRIIQVTELAGMLDETHINLKDIFTFRQTGTDKNGGILGDFYATGYIPSFFEEIKLRGASLSEDIFKPKT